MGWIVKVIGFTEIDQQKREAIYQTPNEGLHCFSVLLKSASGLCAVLSSNWHQYDSFSILDCTFKGLTRNVSDFCPIQIQKGESHIKSLGIWRFRLTDVIKHKQVILMNQMSIGGKSLMADMLFWSVYWSN